MLPIPVVRLWMTWPPMHIVVVRSLEQIAATIYEVIQQVFKIIRPHHTGTV